MLHEVDVGEQRIGHYRHSVGEEVVHQLHDLAGALRGTRVLHISATPYGGGVAELLRSEIPLLRDLGIDAHWQLITADDGFFEATKRIHNALQGGKRQLDDAGWDDYLATTERNARRLNADFDVIVVHDPQPLAIPSFIDTGRTPWIWRCHIDTSEPEPCTWGFLTPYLEQYAAGVFTMADFVPPGFPAPVEVIAPAIDPESPKNLELEPNVARRVLGWIGVDLGRPLVTQVSRFDAWKDPLGVIAAFRLARTDVPRLQLAMVGSMALDDPEGWEIYREIQGEVADDPDIHVFTNLTGVGNIEVNAFQTLSDVIVQKSIREGFGLVVSESLWKRTPVVAGRAGGIPMQMAGGAGGFLVDSVDDCAARLVELLLDPALRNHLGASGRDLVREHFLLPRLIGDDLRLYRSVLEIDRGAAASA